MKALTVMLVIAVSVQAQSLADAARKERERQAKLRPSRVITSTATKVEEPKAPSAAAEEPKPADNKAVPEPPKAAPKPQTPPPVDPVQVWNTQLDQLRAKIRALQDQEMALILQENQTTNQVYAPVTDPATQERALAQLGHVQQQLATVRKNLDEARKMLDGMQLQGPPKK
jgi:hypothetical protein